MDLSIVVVFPQWLHGKLKDLFLRGMIVVLNPAYSKE
jgi:hypothetical protein